MVVPISGMERVEKGQVWRQDISRVPLRAQMSGKQPAGKNGSHAMDTQAWGPGETAGLGGGMSLRTEWVTYGAWRLVGP